MACSPATAGSDRQGALNGLLPRAFVAVDLEPVDRRALHALRRQLGGDTTRGWLAEDDLHITLRFLGDIDPLRAAEIAARCSALAATTPVSTAMPKALEAWPPGRPQVLVLTLAVESALVALQRASVDLPAAAMLDERPWRPHISLRRARSVALPRLPEGPLIPTPLRCQRLSLFARADHGAPVRYRRAASWPLGESVTAPG